MASDGSAPKLDAGQMNIKKNFTVAMYCALMMILLNDGVGARANDAKPISFMTLPNRIRNPRGAGLSHHGARDSNFVPLPEVHNPRGTEESESVPEVHANTIEDDNTRPRFAHMPGHLHDPRGARLPRPTEEDQVNVDSVSQVDDATPAVNQVRFSHLPRLHNPRGVNVVKQIRTAQEGVSKESGPQAGDEGDKN